jgi:hypothetical protein
MLHTWGWDYGVGSPPTFVGMEDTLGEVVGV